MSMVVRLLLPCLAFACLAGALSEWAQCPEGGCPDLAANSLDLSPLKGAWETVFFKQREGSDVAEVPYFYNISVCGPLPGSSCLHSHVCHTKHFAEFSSLGSHQSCRYRYSDRQLQFHLNYDSEAERAIGSGNVTITLICGKTLGVPEVVKGDPDDLSIEIIWITSAACKTDSELVAKNESKCYFIQPYEDSGTKARFIDLTGLIKPGGYEAVYAERSLGKFQFGVCRSLETNDACNGAMVCLKTKDPHFFQVDDSAPPLALAYRQSAQSGLHLEGSLLTAVFESREPSSQCGSNKRTVKIHYTCPEGDEEFGPSITYLDDSLCLMIVNWVTSLACGSAAVQSSSCKLTTSSGVNFDLSGLGDSKVVTTDDSKGHTYSYELEVCSGRSVTVDCGGEATDTPVRVAQFDGGTCHSLGTGDGRLRYADGALTLTYTYGDTCHSNYARTSVINFVCPEVVGEYNSSAAVKFLGEESCHYEFEWATPLACGAQTSGASDCRFELSGKEYNFAPLVGSADKNWVAIDNDDATACFMLNPCGELATTADPKSATDLCNSRLAPESCAGTSVCRVLKDRTGVKIGRFDLTKVSELTRIDSNVVTVVGEGDATHKAVIHYICKTGDFTTPPVYVNVAVNQSYYEFHWATFAACPIGVQAGENCIVSDAATGFTFNLTSLKGQTYSFATEKYQFEMSVCGALEGTGCPEHSALCQKPKPSGSAKSLGQASSSLVYADGTLKLHYNSGDKCKNWPHRNSTILFQCDSTAHSPVINNITELGYCQYIAEVRTKLACPPAFRATECVHIDSKGSHDLSELSREVGNWQAVGPDGAVYYINVCQPLNGVAGCSPLASICKVKSEGGKMKYTTLALASSVNTTVVPPIFHLMKERVMLSYSFSKPSAGDSKCETIHSHIILVCDPTVTEETHPEYISGGDEANPCSYNFKWRTVSACHVKPAYSHSCAITDPESGYTYDLSPLHTPERPFYTVEDDKYTYNITACAPLPVPCSPNATVCQGPSSSDNGNAKKFKCGDFSTQNLRYFDGSLSLQYSNGDHCHHTTPQTARFVTINFECDRTVHVGQPKYIKENDCRYVFEWPTALACPPRELECMAEGGKYDLRPLLENREWEVNIEATGEGPWKVVVGGCRSLDLDARPECPQVPGLGACSYYPGHTPGSGNSLGFVTGDIVVEEKEVLRLSYYNGEKCVSGGHNHSRTVNIFFRCNPDSGAGVPTMISDKDCVSNIDWFTQYACLDDSTSSGTWAIKDPVTGVTFDLSSLTEPLSVNYTEFGGSKYIYTVGLAGKSVPCPGEHGEKKNFGACQTRAEGDAHPKLLGLLNSTLSLVDGKVRVEYGGGDVCHHNGVHRKAVITFVCDRSEGGARLEALPEQDCEYSFLVHTTLVCAEEDDIGVECFASGFDDLSELLSLKTPPIVLSSEAKVYLSVCRPIGSGNQQDPAAIAHCPSGSSACIFFPGNKTWLSLGRPTPSQPPRLLDSGNGVLLHYTSGDKCTSQPSQPFHTQLLLICNRNEPEGAPTFSSRSGCEFIFRWETAHACPIDVPSSAISPDVCFITDTTSGDKLNFYRASFQTVTGADKTSPTYFLNLCGSSHSDSTPCPKGGICRKSSEGKMDVLLSPNHQFVVTSHSPRVVEVVYPDGTQCGGGDTWTGLVTLQCKPRGGSPTPVLVSDRNCRLEFLWQNSLFCAGAELCMAVDKTSGSIYDLDALFSSRWRGSSEHGDFVMTVCKNLNPFSPEKTDKCSAPSGICLSSGAKNINIGHMTTPPRVDHTSSDGAVIVLNYTDGDVCQGERKHFTEVTLVCSHSQRLLMLKTSPHDACSHSVRWETPLACSAKTTNSTDCVFSDPFTTRTFNFNPLAHKMTFSQDSQQFSVCLCPGGACKPAAIWQEGSPSLKLGEFHHISVPSSAAGPKILFSQNGDQCGHGNLKYQSTVFMVCDRQADKKGSLTLQESLSSDCEKYFIWSTPYACISPEVSCVLPVDSHKYDFALLHTERHWTVKNGDDTYLINICGPIDISGTDCSPQSAVCVKTASGQYEDLATASTQEITTSSDKIPLIKFSGPQKCRDRKSQVILTMACGLGGLKFLSNSSCIYNFKWSTPYACKEDKTWKEINCEGKSTTGRSQGNYDFFPTDLIKPAGYTVTTDQGKFHISFCDELSVCGGGYSVCLEQGDAPPVPIASYQHQKVRVEGPVMEIEMSNAENTKHVIISVVCAVDDNSQDEGTLEKMTLESHYSSVDGHEYFYFSMKTEKGCSFDTPPPTSSSHTTSVTTATATPKTDSSTGKVVVALVAVVAIIVLVALIVFFLYNRERRARVLNKLWSLVSPKAPETVEYHKVPTHEETALLELDSQTEDEGEGEGEGRRGKHEQDSEDPDDEELLNL